MSVTFLLSWFTKITIDWRLVRVVYLVYQKYNQLYYHHVQIKHCIFVISVITLFLTVGIMFFCNLLVYIDSRLAEREYLAAYFEKTGNEIIPTCGNCKR